MVDATTTLLLAKNGETPSDEGKIGFGGTEARRKAMKNLLNALNRIERLADEHGKTVNKVRQAAAIAAGELCRRVGVGRQTINITLEGDTRIVTISTCITASSRGPGVALYYGAILLAFMEEDGEIRNYSESIGGGEAYSFCLGYPKILRAVEDVLLAREAAYQRVLSNV